MGVLLTALLIAGARPAHADLYRWVDPHSGSVKYSSVPPPASQAGVQVIPSRAHEAPASPGHDALELRWREVLAGISAAAPGSPELEQRLTELAAVATALDRADPAGSQRRRAQAQAVLRRFLKVER